MEHELAALLLEAYVRTHSKKKGRRFRVPRPEPDRPEKVKSIKQRFVDVARAVKGR